ncbi:hypothetical protein SAMN05660206_103290 [Sphingobacterium wenxiniae]|uniref:Uncharacterized protein n=1 Tax=Sphingobacterium wenxiniae TaxID=683125 RepID=A0A1I6RAX2_9SPHI|nr:hypothetical protein SAMN05660206_103290 [Sphingobacterium wenxiniae]
MRHCEEYNDEAIYIFTVTPRQNRDTVASGDGRITSTDS